MALITLDALGQSRPAVALPTTQPVPPETVAQTFQRLARARSGPVSRDELALKTVLDLALAIGTPDGHRGGRLIDVVGYHVLPLEGPLPEKPDKPLSPDAVQALIARRRPVPVGDRPVDSLEIMDRATLRPIFPAVADWMLPDDVAVVISPAAPDDWVTQRCCVVVRIRGRKASVVAGNLLAALPRSP